MNKKGFTLIELLAVIVILAIILLIAMPIVLNILDEARRGAFNATGYGLVKTAENEYLRRSLDGTPDAVTYSFSGGEQQAPDPASVDELEFSGEAPTVGGIHVTSGGVITMTIHDGVYCSYKGPDTTDVTTEEMDLAGCDLTAAPWTP